ncbi:MAG TPA: hypothetical protein V6D30_17680 [Leptolyngbyaceae cyanobacterium]
MAIATGGRSAASIYRLSQPIRSSLRDYYFNNCYWLAYLPPTLGGMVLT